MPSFKHAINRTRATPRPRSPSASEAQATSLPQPQATTDDLVYDSSVLHRDEDQAAAIERRQPSNFSRAENEARVKAVRSINAIRLLSPALRAALDAGPEEEAQVNRFTQLMDQANQSAAEAVVTLGLTPDKPRDRWAMNVLERVFVEALAGPPTHTPSPGLARLVSVAGEARAVVNPDADKPSLPLSPAIRLSLIKALMPVWRAQTEFDFFRQDQSADLHEAASRLLDQTLLAVKTLVDPLTADDERLSVFRAVLEESGTMLAHAWHTETVKARRVLEGRSAADLKRWRASNPSGFPLEKVWLEFETQMGRLVRLSGLARPQLRR